MLVMALSADPERIKRHLTEVSIPRDIFSDPQNLLKVQKYIEDRFTSFGFLVEKQSFELRGETFTNLIARARDFDTNDRFIIAAHFDAVPETPGADDNASGVAALLESARLLAASKAVRHIEFIAFNAEEYGMIGSSFYAKALKQNQIKISGMVSLEMVGFASDRPGSQGLPGFLKPFYPDTGNFIGLVGNTGSNHLIRKAKDAFNKVRDLPVQTITLPMNGWFLPAARLSDHSPFWDAGFPALLITDTSFFRNPHYHTPDDCVDTLNLECLTHVTDAVIQLGLLFA